MISPMFAVHFCAAACIKVLQIGWHQRTSVQFTLFIKEGIIECVLLYVFRVSHNLQTRQQFDVARSPALVYHAYTFFFIRRAILRPILGSQFLSLPFVAQTCLFISACGDRATRCSFAAWTNIELRNVIRSGCAYAASNQYNQKYDADTHDFLLPLPLFTSLSHPAQPTCGPPFRSLFRRLCTQSRRPRGRRCVDRGKPALVQFSSELAIDERSD